MFERVDRTGAMDGIVVRHLFVVSRDHPWLYAHLVERFERDPNVDVIFDRRIADRRMESAAVAAERRLRDRRQPVSAEDDLSTRSHFVVEL